MASIRAHIETERGDASRLSESVAQAEVTTKRTTVAVAVGRDGMVALVITRDGVLVHAVEIGAESARADRATTVDVLDHPSQLDPKTYRVPVWQYLARAVRWAGQS